MNNILLLGAGFSRNWNGRLASEVRSPLQTQLKSDPYISQLLQKHDFETVLSMVQAEFGQKPDGLTEGRLRTTQAAVKDVFSRMNLAFQRRMTMEFGNAAPCARSKSRTGRLVALHSGFDSLSVT